MGSDTFWIVRVRLPASFPSLKLTSLKPTLVINSVQILASIRAYLEVSAISHGRARTDFEAYSIVRSGLTVTSKPAGEQKKPNIIHYSVLTDVVVQLLSAVYAWMLANYLYGEIISTDFINKRPDLIIPTFHLWITRDSWRGDYLIILMYVVPITLYIITPLVSRFKLEGWRISQMSVAPPSMPYPGNSSLAISVACHPMEQEGNIAEAKLQWGVVKQKSENTPGRLAFTKLPTLEMHTDDKYFGAHVPAPPP